MTADREYPEPVIAAYLQAVRALPVPMDDLVRAAQSREWRSRQRWWIRLMHWCILWFVDATFRLSIASATLTVDDPSAKAAYRSLLLELKRRGWPSEARLRVVHGLYALRGCDVHGASGDRLYKRSMESVVPRESIGWVAR